MIRPPIKLMISVVLLWGSLPVFAGEKPTAEYHISRCEVVPVSGHQVEFRIDGELVLKWHYGPQYPRPFFFPLLGPSGVPLTRMGHPGAPDHEHHRSIWFAHHNVNGQNFWSEQGQTKVRQTRWLAYAESDEEGVMASQLVWEPAESQPLMKQDVIAAVRPMKHKEYCLELQLTFTPFGRKEVVLEKTNFGILAIRVSKSLSAVFGGGELTGSGQQKGEKELFGQQARWMDYSGPIVVGVGDKRRVVQEGITLFDHPQNPRYPTHWHVRNDGWMGASLCMQESLSVTSAKPLVLRYLIYAHSGVAEESKLDRIHTQFAKRPGFELLTKPKPHHQYGVQRLAP